ncbi:MAG TPA: N-acetylmuramoyl-L-alanine amidase [Bryobacteraceae bacterium]|nr:N-acetylmuramoyl-L-alanine amidase [Bryobacteraceae bacterium]
MEGRLTHLVRQSSAMRSLPRRILSTAVIAATALCAQPLAQAATSEPRITAIRFWSFSDVTRVAIEIKGPYHVVSDHLDSPPRLVFDLKGILPPNSTKVGPQIFPVGDRLIRQIRVAETEPGVSRIVFDLEVPSDFTSSQLVDPDRLMIEVRPKSDALARDLSKHSRVGLQRVSETSTPSAAERRTAPVPETLKTSEPTPTAVKGSVSDINKSEEADIAPPPSTLVWHDAKHGTTTRSVSPVKKEGRSATTGSRNTNESATRKRAVEHESGDSAAATRTGQSASKSGSDINLRVAPAKISDANPSLVRVFGLKIHKVVIDAGHGGHDTGTIGPRGLMEKDLVLDVALRLGKLVRERMGAEVVFTRSTDTFIPLEQRTKIANDEKADLFISIHANSSPAASATGVETYYFNFTSDQNSLDLATRENASSASSIFQLNDLLHRAVLNAKVEESRDFAQRVQSSLYTMSARMNKSSRNRGVKKAPFVVLIGATMPSILAEVGFVSNRHDERFLKREDQREKIAEALYKGISKYAATLSHDEIARAKDKD